MGKAIFAGVCVFSFLFVYICSISAVSLQAIKVAGYESLANKSVSCTFIDPMEGPVPNPLNCTEFFVCRVADNTSYTIPDRIPCPLGFNNRSTYYDFRTCTCEHNNTGCFNPAEHGNADFFGCTTLFNPNPTTVTSETFTRVHT